ncbi:MAG: sigma-70 family RNA polymerase sigma factor [Acidobacteriota bacterium]
MFKPWPIKQGHEDLFISHYEQLLRWAMKLAGQDHQLAEDIVHDAFIQFTLARPDLASIQNIEAYFYTMLRNRHISRVRRSARFTDSLPVIEYDSADAGLRAADPRDQIHAQEELSAICRYACARKETSRAGSILILRFFYGFYPVEISRIIKGTRAAVDSWVSVARAEARAFLDDRRNFHIIRQSAAAPSKRDPDDDFLTQMRQQILDSRQGECLRRIEKLYDERNTESPDARRLGHIVSCKDCLDRVCAILGLAPPSDRHPTDSIGVDRMPGKGATDRSLSSGMNLRSQVFEHRPRKLFVSANGFFLGSHSISSQSNELTISARIDEQIGFVEILSEQGFLLLAMDVEPPPSGDLEQMARIEMSDSRALEAVLSFVDSRPEIQVRYSDPQFIEAPATIEDEYEPADVLSTQEASRPSRLIDFARRVFNRDFLLRPATITIIAAMIISLVLLVARFRPQAVSAAELLDRAEAAERAAADNPQIALHRTLSLEEREDGNLVSRLRIEIWQSGQSVARRVFDDDTLIAGEWANEKGATVFESGGVRRLAQRADLSLADAWRMEPSARMFSALVQSRDRALVKEDSLVYIISFESDELTISLTLNKADMRATEQTLSFRRGTSRVEYNLTEEKFERAPRRMISPFVFEPDTNLPKERGETKEEMKSETPSSEMQTVATADLEVEVRWLLDQIRANQGEQVEVARARGKLMVEGIVETDERKREILSALSPVINHPAVRVEILTIAEAKRIRGSRFSTARSEQIEIPTGATIPLYSEVKTYLASRGITEDRMDEEINRYAKQIIAISREALGHAWALRRITQSQSKDLSEEARARRLSMIRRHALAFEERTARLRSELGQIIAIDAAAEEYVEIKDEASLARAIARLIEAASFNDEAVQSSMTVSAARSTAMVKTYRFRLSLRRAEQLAASIKTASDLR